MKNAKKITSILIVAGITLTMAGFSGCSSKTVAAKQTNTNGQQGNGGNRKFDPAAMKTSYETALKTLVTAGTITQVQSDKVLAAVTKNIPTAGAKGQGTQQTTKPKNSKAQNGQTRTRTNPLSELVTSKVITQVQADAINQKIRGNVTK